MLMDMLVLDTIVCELRARYSRVSMRLDNSL